MAELIPISGCEDLNRKLDLIFVHGLNGDSHTTWQKDNDPAKFWPGWLGEDFPKIGVWSLDYEVSASDWKGHSMPLYNRARNSLELFDLKKIGHRPIGFVCHSLGGLLVKEILRLANEFNHASWKTIAEQTRFIVFLSTPHSGTNMPNWINYIGKLLRTSVSVRELEASNPQLLQLNNWYRSNAGQLKIKTYVFFENLPTHGILVVNEASADPGITGVQPIPLDADHSTICKLDKKSGHVYERISQLLYETLSSIKNTNSTSPANMPAEEKVNPDFNQYHALPNHAFPGSLKLAFCERLGTSWRNLADILEIKPSDQALFQQGLEPRAIWEWLHERERLTELPWALRSIDRNNLAEEFNRYPPQTAGQQSGINVEALQAFYQQCVTNWSKPRYALDSRFVDLTLLIDQGADAQGPRWQPKSEKFQSLNEVLAHTTEPLVILGAPGSGKSTLLRHFELINAQAALDQLKQNPTANTHLTFFIQLNDFKGQRASDPTPLPLEWLSERWAHYHPDLPDLRALIKAERITLLLDALNEIPYRNAEVIQLWKDFLAELEAFQSNTRVIFTCRSLDYSAPLSSKERPVPQVRIESLSDDKIQDFLRQYSPDHGETLWRNLKHGAQLDLFRSPYFLKMLIEESIDGQIPSGHAALFTAFVRRLIKREIENPNNLLFEAGDLLNARDIQRLTLASGGRTDYELPKRGRLIPKLGLLAFQMQKLSQQQGSGQVKIDYDQALAMLEDPLSEEILVAGVAMNVLEQDLAQDQVFYIHQLLQEYFAAHHFAAAPEPDLAHQAWRRGDNTSAGQKLQWREKRKYLQAHATQIREWQRQGRITSEQADDWETIAQWSDEFFEAQLSDNFPGGRLTEPAFWQDDTFNRPAQPVVGICWHEANAYCAWLGAHSSQAFRLPSEAEWEAAARGSIARRLAYGDTFDSRRTNTFESHIRAATPVGVFPDGNTVEGLQDMTGNVWEWTSSLLQSYPYDPHDGRENPDGPDDGRRVVRGGSWYSLQVSARAAVRYSFTPGSRYYDLGFRLACSSHIVHPLQGHRCRRPWNVGRHLLSLHARA